MQETHLTTHTVFSARRSQHKTPHQTLDNDVTDTESRSCDSSVGGAANWSRRGLRSAQRGTAAGAPPCGCIAGAADTCGYAVLPPRWTLSLRSCHFVTFKVASVCPHCYRVADVSITDQCVLTTCTLHCIPQRSHTGRDKQTFKKFDWFAKFQPNVYTEPKFCLATRGLTGGRGSPV